MFLRTILEKFGLSQELTVVEVQFHKERIRHKRKGSNYRLHAIDVCRAQAISIRKRLARGGKNSKQYPRGIAYEGSAITTMLKRRLLASSQGRTGDLFLIPLRRSIEALRQRNFIHTIKYSILSSTFLSRLKFTKESEKMGEFRNRASD